MSRIVDIFSATVMQGGGTKEDRALAASGLSRLTPLYARIVSGGKTICHDDAAAGETNSGIVAEGPSARRPRRDDSPYSNPREGGWVQRRCL